MDAKEMQVLVAQIGAVIHDAMGISDHPNYRAYTYATLIEFGTNVTTLPQTGTGTITIDSLTSFVGVAVRVSSRIDGTDGMGIVPMTASENGATEIGGWPDAPYLIQIEDGSGDRQWHNRSVDARALYGEGAPNKGVLARPRRMRGGSTITVTLTLLKVSAAAMNHEALVQFIGYKVGG